MVPACGSLIAPISLATGTTPLFLGKPNPLIMRSALQNIGVPRENAVIIGDRMETDILAGVESEIYCVLVMTGVTTSLSQLSQFAYRPNAILSSLRPIFSEQ